MPKELKIGMQIFNTETGEISTQRVLNFMNPQHRQLIAKSAWWAMHNKHTITTWPLETDEVVEFIYKKVETHA